eukprot:1379531-Pyramimonas_sp.AAC.1
MVALVTSSGTFEDGALEALDAEISRRQKLDAAEHMAKWKTRAKKAVAGEGKAAHAFSKKQASCLSGRGGDGDDLPVAGQAALRRLLDQWVPMWQVGGRGPHPSTWEILPDEPDPAPLRLSDCVEYAASTVQVQDLAGLAFAPD